MTKFNINKNKEEVENLFMEIENHLKIIDLKLKKIQNGLR